MFAKSTQQQRSNGNADLRGGNGTVQVMDGALYNRRRAAPFGCQLTIRVLRADTRANSEATKNEFAKTRTNTISRSEKIEPV